MLEAHDLNVLPDLLACRVLLTELGDDQDLRAVQLLRGPLVLPQGWDDVLEAKIR